MYCRVSLSSITEPETQNEKKLLCHAAPGSFIPEYDHNSISKWTLWGWPVGAGWDISFQTPRLPTLDWSSKSPLHTTSTLFGKLYHVSLFKIQGKPCKPLEETCHYSSVWVFLLTQTNGLPKIWQTAGSTALQPQISPAFFSSPPSVSYDVKQHL